MILADLYFINTTLIELGMKGVGREKEGTKLG